MKKILLIGVLIILFISGMGCKKEPVNDTIKHNIFDISQLRQLKPAWEYNFESGWNAKETVCSWGKRNIEAKQWDWAQMQGEYAGEVVADPLNPNNKVMKFEWRKGEGIDCDKNSQKKAHIYGKPGTMGKAEYWSFDVFFPSEGMEIDSEPEIVIQWHGVKDDDCYKEGRRNAPLSLNIENDKLKVVWMYDDRKCTPFWYRNDRVDTWSSLTIGNVPKDKWTKFEFYFRFDPFGKAFLLVWMDGNKVVDKRNIKMGFNDYVGPFLGFGIYKYTLNSDYTHRIIYFDNIKQSIT